MATELGQGVLETSYILLLCLPCRTKALCWGRGKPHHYHYFSELKSHWSQEKLVGKSSQVLWRARIQDYAGGKDRIIQWYSTAKAHGLTRTWKGTLQHSSPSPGRHGVMRDLQEADRPSLRPVEDIKLSVQQSLQNRQTLSRDPAP
jgi:hypothetical protein